MDESTADSQADVQIGRRFSASDARTLRKSRKHRTLTESSQLDASMKLFRLAALDFMVTAT
eukprot:915649-Pleurochrysis_carterae.AAC.1